MICCAPIHEERDQFSVLTAKLEEIQQWRRKVGRRPSRKYCDGDIAVFEHGPEPRPGQIVAALIDRKNTLKTFLLKNGKPFLKAENPKYPDLIPSEELMIQGVFHALIRKSKD